MIRLLELFGGIGACSAAMERCGIDYEIADYVEIDKYAVKSYNAIHSTNFEPQDITKWDKDIPVDVIMHGSPCQDFSIAGNQAGGDKGSGTRSSLMYETIRIVEKLYPKVVIWENVKNLIGKKHKHNFDAYIETMNQLGYQNYYQVLNAKDYGIPQNRERIFTISIRGEHEPFEFPQKQELKLRLKDILQKNTDAKYYLSEEQTKRIKFNTKSSIMYDKSMIGFEEYAREYNEISPAITAREYKEPRLINVNEINKIEPKITEPSINMVGMLEIKGAEQVRRVYGVDGLSPTLNTMQGGNRQPKIVEPFIAASRGRNPENPSDRTAGSPTVQMLEPNSQGISNTLTSVQKDNYVVEPIHNYTSDLRIRKLTPLECWRLMGFDDNDFYKAEKVNSNTQLYKQAGNSIVVDVLCAILRNLKPCFVSE